MTTMTTTREISQASLNPIFSTSFDVEFTSVHLSDDEKDILKTCVKSVSEKKVRLGVFYDDSKKIIPLDALIKLKSGPKSDVIIYILDSDGKSIGTLIYKECNVEVDFKEFLSFGKVDKTPFGINFENPKEITINLFPSAILYNNQEI